MENSRYKKSKKINKLKNKLRKLRALYNPAKLRVAIIWLLLVMATSAVISRLYEIQFVESADLKYMSLRQRMGVEDKDPARGLIYDRHYRLVAGVAPVVEVRIELKDIKNDDEARLIAGGLAEILGVDSDEIYEKTQWTDKASVNVKHLVELGAADEIRKFNEKNNIKAVFFRPQFKRIYPYGELAAHVIGFTGLDNGVITGVFGIEKYYEEYLCGSPGRKVMIKNALRQYANLEYASYTEVKNGSNIVLTIDVTAQAALEKYLAAAFAASMPRERVTGIIIDVNTGEIYAMATLPSYDLNAPYAISAETLDLINLDSWTLYAMGKEEFASDEAREARIKEEKEHKLRQNKAISASLEPGSTMKLLTIAAALEERAVRETDRFYCSGTHTVADREIKCHLYGGHGALNLAEGLQSSCNPVAMRAAEKLGTTNYLKYFNAFGFNQKTGIDLPGETKGVMHEPEKFRAVELATASFGQRFEITPMQLIAGVAAIANGGKLITPRVVKAIIDDDGNIIKEFEPEIKRSVLSEATSKSISRILADGVAGGGSARNAFVNGYEIAAKTGTSEKGVGTTARIGSCVAYAPADDPKVAILIIVDEPTVGSVFGGVIAAPFVSKTLAEILPYLGIELSYIAKELEERPITVRNYETRELKDAKEDIESRGLRYIIIGSGEYVRAQSPKAGNALMKNGSIVLYTDNGENAEDSEIKTETVIIPNLYGLTASEARSRLAGARLNINITGAEGMESRATAIEQHPAAGETAQIGAIIAVEFRHSSVSE